MITLLHLPEIVQLNSYKQSTLDKFSWGIGISSNTESCNNEASE